MSAANGTVRDRFAHVGASLSPLQVAVGLGLLAVVLATLVFVQEPAVHHALHDFRHVAGVTCH